MAVAGLDRAVCWLRVHYHGNAEKPSQACIEDNASLMRTVIEDKTLSTYFRLEQTSDSEKPIALLDYNTKIRPLLVDKMVHLLASRHIGKDDLGKIKIFLTKDYANPEFFSAIQWIDALQKDLKMRIITIGNMINQSIPHAIRMRLEIDYGIKPGTSKLAGPIYKAEHMNAEFSDSQNLILLTLLCHIRKA